jgi:hypothetical protein
MPHVIARERFIDPQCQTATRVGWAKARSAVPTLCSTEASSAWASRSLSSGRPLRTGPVGSAHPTKTKKEAERRQTQYLMTRTSGCGTRHGQNRLAPTRPLSGALACRRSTTALAKGSISSPRLSPGQASWDAASTGRASRRRRRTHFQRCTPRAGRNAGRHDTRTARERIATPPAGTDLAPTPGYACRTRPFGRGFDSLMSN